MSPACCSLPDGFTRLRYFFGKRLSVADFADEQIYHAGKMRLHNHFAHGAGVLCGLGVELFAPSSPTVLRVVKGAAIGPCGREIIVGADQCIDINAWYQKKHEEDARFADALRDADGLLPLCVTIEYTECKASPEPAPRDPCSCAEGGCDYGRTRESFVLRLMPEAEARVLDPPALSPSRDALATAIARATGPQSLRKEITALLGAGCPEEPDETWLVLGCFRAELSADASSIVAIQDQTGGPILLSTSVIQELLLLGLGQAGMPAALGGPEISGVEFAVDGGAATTFHLSLHLSSELEPTTFQPAAFSLQRFEAGVGWSAPGAGVVSAAYQAAPEPHIDVTIDSAGGFLVDGGHYRLHFRPDAASPIVDSDMRPLTPDPFSWDFDVIDDSGVLVMAPPPHAA